MTLEEAKTLHQQGKLAEAEAAYRALLADQALSAEGLGLLGVLCQQSGRPDEAVRHLRAALATEPDNAKIAANLGAVLQQQDRHEDAVEVFTQLHETHPDDPGITFNLASALQFSGRIAAAAGLYRQLLERTPDHPNALTNLAAAERELGNFQVALDLATRAIEASAASVELLITRGLAATSLSQFESALKDLRAACDLAPQDRLPRYSLAIGEAKAGNKKAAIALLRPLAEQDAGYRSVAQRLVELLYSSCTWEDLDLQLGRLNALTQSAIKENRAPPEKPFFTMCHFADPVRNLAVARAESEAVRLRVTGGKIPALPQRALDPGRRLKLGYLSRDFRGHAGGHLMSGLFGAHDRSAFEVTCFSYGPADDSPARKQIAQEADHFIDVASLSLRETAARINEAETDILIFRDGHTQQNRLGVCALRPAPIQISFLGFPSTTGADYIDYLIADAVVAPKAHRAFFSEKIIAMPGCYQINNHRQQPKGKASTRQAEGLPEDGFVFCCFNQPNKLTPALFDIWADILRAVPGAVLWLLDGRDDYTNTNLRVEFTKRGLDPARLILARRVALFDHLARIALADLALDTLICNGHTTTSDTLWAGVPVVAMSGTHFASRVSESILRAMDLGALVAPDRDGYKNLAITLARDREKLQELRAAVAQAQLESPLFDTRGYVGHLEVAYREVWRRHCAGLTPEDVNVAAKCAKLRNQKPQ